MSKPRVLKGESKNYQILFTNLGIARMEEETPIKLPKLLSFIQKAATIQTGKSTKASRAKALNALGLQIGVMEILGLLLAGLEGYRLKFKPAEDPYTLDRVSDIMDDCGGLIKISVDLGEAFQDYWPKLAGTKLEAPKAKKGPASSRKR